jgi:hypothetical protein
MSPTQPSDPTKKPKKAVPAPSPNAKVLTNAQAADRLGVSTKTLGRWRQVKEKGPPFIKPGADVDSKSNTHVRYRIEDLDEWARKNRWASPLHKMQGWLIDDAGIVLGPAAPGYLGDDVIIATIYEALTDEKWASTAAMTKAWDDWRAEMKLAEEEIKRSFAVCERDEMAKEVAGQGREKPAKKGPIM